MPNQEPLIKITPREAVEKIKAWFADHTLPKFCNYRDADGCKCAIGVLIPDDIYVKYISPYAARPGLRVGHLSHVIGEANRVNPDGSGALFDDDIIGFLHAVQIAHDAWVVGSLLPEFERRAKFLADLDQLLQNQEGAAPCPT